MDLKVLGCSGGIGGAGARTTSFLLDGHTLLDAGTGVGDLDLDEMARIDRVFLTHAHLDHIACLPLMLDSTIGMREKPVEVYALPAVISALKTHLFNWLIWPDFSVIPSVENPCFRFIPVELGQCISLDGVDIQVLPVNHHVPSVAYQMTTQRGSVVFSGDTGRCDALKAALQTIAPKPVLIVECAFPDQEKALAERSGHFSPETLAHWLSDLDFESLYVTHLKPQFAEQTMDQIRGHLAARSVNVLQLSPGSVITV